MSQCKYCLDQIIWIQKPNGAWFPPFNSTPELKSLQYELHWDEELNDWIASPLDKGLSLKLSMHECPVRAELKRRQAEEEEEMATLPPPPIGTVASPLVRTFERVVYRNPDPDKLIKVAKRLSIECPTCQADPFDWCTYLNNPEEKTTNLHTSRTV